MSKTVYCNTPQQAPGRRVRHSRALVAALLTATSLGLGACASTYPAPVYESRPGYASVEGGYIEDVAYYESGSSNTSGAGAVIGGIAGGVIGHQIGGGVGNTVATVAGAVGGALLGNEIERNNKGSTSYTVVRIRLDSGERISVNQAPDFRLREGERVRIYDRARIIRG